jgi:hypothetical protein
VRSDPCDYWVVTTSHDHAFVDRTTRRIEDTLIAHGYGVNSEIKYVKLPDEIANYRTLTTTLTAVGFLVIAISMAGLANTLTTRVIERTREIGILRSIGARARDVRRILGTETIALAAAGWLMGVPIGYVLDRFLSIAGERGGQRRNTPHLPAVEPRDRFRWHNPAGPTDHPSTDKTGRSLPARRRIALCVKVRSLTDSKVHGDGHHDVQDQHRGPDPLPGGPNDVDQPSGEASANSSL